MIASIARSFVRNRGTRCQRTTRWRIMKSKVVSICLALFLASSVGTDSVASESETTRGDGLSVAQFRALANLLPTSAGSVDAILLEKDGLWLGRAAILTGRVGIGWQIFVFHREGNGKIALEWKSGKLDESFQVSSPDQFQIVLAASEGALKFSGCAPHNCPDVFSVMLYVPSKKAVFSATYKSGNVTYSPGSEWPDARFYKASLDRFIAQQRDVTN